MNIYLQFLTIPFYNILSIGVIFGSLYLTYKAFKEDSYRALKSLGMSGLIVFIGGMLFTQAFMQLPKLLAFDIIKISMIPFAFIINSTLMQSTIIISQEEKKKEQKQ